MDLWDKKLIKARIIRSGQKNFDCRKVCGEVIKATAKGTLLKGKESLVVGDYVLVEKLDQVNEYVIKKLLPRENEVFRIIVREHKKKITAANCDYLVIVNSVSKPVMKTGIIDRFLIRAYQWGIEPLIVFNKMDQYNANKCDIVFERDRLKELNLDCFEISAKSESYQNQFIEKGIEDLKETLMGKTAIFLGQSGVGKSQTISRLTGGAVQLKVKSVGKAGKGAHTTTWSELIDCLNFYLIDSPGIRSFSLDDIYTDQLIHYYPDLLPYTLKCKFRDCEHSPKSQGCGFYLNGKISKLLNSRLESYRKLIEELSHTPEWGKKI